jgi:hypothetical protein
LLFFLGKFNSFYESESKTSSTWSEVRKRFTGIDSTNNVEDYSTRVMVKAMANSAIDSIVDSEENHGVISEFFSKLKRHYREEARKIGAVKRQYRELSSGDKLYLFNKYANSGMTRRAFAESNDLSSTYALDRIRKEYGRKSSEYAPISEILNEKSISLVRALAF